MWTDSRWFDVVAFTTLCVVLTVAFGRFERHKPMWRRLGKIVALVALALVLNEGLGRTWAYSVFGLLMLAGTAFHCVVLSKLGINGFTGEPRDKFDALLHEIETHGERRTLLRIARDLPRPRAGGGIKGLVLFACLLSPLVRASTSHGLSRAPGSGAPAEAAAQRAGRPRFEDYPASVEAAGAIVPVRLDSARYGRMYRTRLRDGARAGRNFAGAFTLVMWGCGAPCQIIAIVDPRTGLLSQQTLQTANGVEYRADSRLLIADPPPGGKRPDVPCAACGIEAAYLWNGARFEPLGSGPHPHLAGPRPWDAP